MINSIKTSHGLAVLGASLFFFIVIFNSPNEGFKRLSSLFSIINPHSMTAQVSGTGGSVYHFSSCPSSNNLYTEMFHQMNSRISHITVPSDATTNVYRDPTFLRTWVTAHDGITKLDFTGHSILESDTDYGYTLISPRHAVTAWHLNGFAAFVGQQVPFEGSDGSTTIVTVVGLKEVGTSDIALVVFDRDLPSTVSYYPLLSSSDLTSYATAQVPVVYADQLGDYLIRKMTSNGVINAYSSSSPYYPYGLESYSTLIPGVFSGDSGHPSFYIINNTLVLASTQTSPDGATLLGQYIPQINQAMTDLDAGLSAPTGYQVTNLDLSCFSPNPFTPTTIQYQTFKVDQSAPVNTVVGKVSYTRTNGLLSTTGFTITSGNTSGAFAIDANGQITVANPSALNYQINPTFNLVISMSEAWVSPDDQTDVVQGPISVNVSNVGSASPPVISAVSASSITQIGSTINWTTNIPASSEVFYGLATPSPSYSSSTDPIVTPVTSHSVYISGLAEDTTYHYQVQSSASGVSAQSLDQTFTTATADTPTITSFTISPSTPVRSQPVTLAWTTDGGITSCAIDSTSNTTINNIFSSLMNVVKGSTDSIATTVPAVVGIVNIGTTGTIELGCYTGPNLTGTYINRTVSFAIPRLASSTNTLYTLLVNVGTAGSVSSSLGGLSYCTTNCSVNIRNGTVATLTANPAVGYTTNWTGCDTSNGNSCTVTITGDTTIGLSFTPPYIPDTTSPTVDAFAIPSTFSSLTVSPIDITASDNTAVTGYMLKETSSAPLPDAVGWSSSAPTSYTFSSAGSNTLYAWAKDAAGNVSASKSDSVTITLPNNPPIANAGQDQTVTLPASANL